MKIALRITLTPVLMLARLALCITALITTIASAVIRLTTTIFAVLGVLEFAIGSWQNGIAFFVLAWLTSPIGLPAIANFLMDQIDNLIGFFEGLLC